jgi:hemoglobin
MIAMIDEDAIGVLVRRFYAKVRQDAVIGPLFNQAIAAWEDHLIKLEAFWSSVMLTSGRYKGNPMAAHLRHPIEPAMFDRWLGLWAETAREIFEPPVAAQFEAKAGRIAESLKLALFFRPADLDPARPRVAEP